MSLVESSLSALAAAVFAAVAASAQIAKVEGTVVNGVTGAAIAGAEVFLCEPSDKTKQELCAVTHAGGNGRFAFANNKAGRRYLTSNAPGYLNYYGYPSYTNVFVVSGGQTRSFRLALVPESTIGGRVVDKDGRPVAGIGVTAIREGTRLGRRFVKPHQPPAGVFETKTDARGRFRVVGMTPGKYYLETDFNWTRKDRIGWLIGNGYFPTYYPDSATLAAATPFCIGAGEHRDVEFRWTPKPAFTVRGRLELPPEFQRPFEPMWGLLRDDGQYYGQWTDEVFDRLTGAFEMRGVPDGAYHLEIRTGIYGTDLVGRADFAVTDRDVNGITLSMRRDFALRGTVHLPPGFEPQTPYSTLLDLVPDGDEELMEVGQPLNSNGSVVFAGMRSGRFRLRLFASDPVYVASARFGDQDVLTGGLTLQGPSDTALDIVLATAGGVARGHVAEPDGSPSAGAQVKLMIQGEDAPYVFRSVIADDSGRYVFTGIPPGDYRLVAVREAVADREFGGAEFEQVKSWAKPVRVGDSAIDGMVLEPAPFRYAAPACGAPRSP